MERFVVESKKTGVWESLNLPAMSREEATRYIGAIKKDQESDLPIRFVPATN